MLPVNMINHTASHAHILIPLRTFFFFLSQICDFESTEPRCHPQATSHSLLFPVTLPPPPCSLPHPFLVLSIRQAAPAPGGWGRPEQHRTASTGGFSGYLAWLGAQMHLCFSPLCAGFKMRMHCGKPRASFPQRADGSFDFKGLPRTPSYQRPFLVIIQSQVQLPKLPASL